MSMLISLSHCTKRYVMGSAEVCALNDVSLEIAEGEFALSLMEPLRLLERD